MVPFGLRNAPATFMCIVTSVFSRYLDKFVLVFLYDILINSENEEHLRIALQLLREHKLYANLRKCDFYKDKIHYLGHFISEEGIHVELENIEASMTLSNPKKCGRCEIFYGTCRIL